MKNYIIGGIIGFVLASVIMSFALYNNAQGLMILESQSRYSFSETFQKLDEAIKAKNWKVPKVHDLQMTMSKFGKTVRPVKVIELCHPDHAEKILKENNERVVSSMMPCRVAIYEKEDGKVYVSRMNTKLMAGMMEGVIPDVMDVASKETEEILESILK